MPHRIIRSPDDVQDFAAHLATLKLPVTVEWRKGADRTLDQNRLMWKWATEFAAQIEGETPAEVQARWKLVHGVPILRADSENFRAVYDRLVRPFDYTEKLRIMEAPGFFHVTSIMGVRQMTRFLDAVQKEAAQAGVVLTQPDGML